MLAVAFMHAFFDTKAASALIFECARFPSAVSLDGKQLQMRPEETEQEHILGLTSGELMLLWQKHRPDIGHAVEIITGARSGFPIQSGGHP